MKPLCATLFIQTALFCAGALSCLPTRGQTVPIEIVAPADGAALPWNPPLTISARSPAGLQFQAVTYTITHASFTFVTNLNTLPVTFIWYPWEQGDYAISMVATTAGGTTYAVTNHFSTAQPVSSEGIEITSPGPNSNWSPGAPVTLSAVSAENLQFSGLNFIVQGPTRSDSFYASRLPASFDWWPWVSGTHILKVVGDTTSGAHVEKSVTFYASATTPITIRAPIESAVIPAGIVQMDLLLPHPENTGVLLDGSNAQLECCGPVTSGRFSVWSIGNHTLTINNSGASASVHFTVTNAPPVATLYGVFDGEQHDALEQIPIDIGAVDNDVGLASIELFVNDVSLQRQAFTAAGARTTANSSLNWSTNRLGFYDFRFVAQDLQGLISTATARIEIAACTNDAFSSPIQLFGARGTFRESTIGLTKEPGEPAHAGDAGGASAWLAWTPQFSGTATFSIVSAQFATLLAVYDGSSLATLKPIASGQGSATVTNTISFSAAAGHLYRIAIDGKAGASGYVFLTWSQTGTPKRRQYRFDKQLSKGDFVGETQIIQISELAGTILINNRGDLAMSTAQGTVLKEGAVMRFISSSREALRQMDSADHVFSGFQNPFHIDAAEVILDQSLLNVSYDTYGPPFRNDSGLFASGQISQTSEYRLDFQNPSGVTLVTLHPVVDRSQFYYFYDPARGLNNRGEILTAAFGDLLLVKTNSIRRLMTDGKYTLGFNDQSRVALLTGFEMTGPRTNVVLIGDSRMIGQIEVAPEAATAPYEYGPMGTPTLIDRLPATLNNNNEIAYFTPQRVLVSGGPVVSSVIADQGMLDGKAISFFGLHFNGAFNDSGVIAFWASFDDGSEAYYTATPLPQVDMSSILLSPEAISFAVTGQNNQTAVIESSTDMIHWTEVATTVLNGSVNEVQAPRGSAASGQFYRVSVR